LGSVCGGRSLSTRASSPAASLLAQPAQATSSVRFAMSLLRERLEDPDQLVLAREVDLYPPGLALAEDAHARAEVDLQALFGRSRVNVGRRHWAWRARRRAADLAAFERGLHERFGLTDAEAARLDLARHAHLQGLGAERQDRARVPHRQGAGREIVLQLVRQLEQAQRVGDRRAILPDRGGNGVLRERELVDEASICLGLFD